MGVWNNLGLILRLKTLLFRPLIRFKYMWIVSIFIWGFLNRFTDPLNHINESLWTCWIDSRKCESIQTYMSPWKL